MALWDGTGLSDRTAATVYPATPKPDGAQRSNPNSDRLSRARRTLTHAIGEDTRTCAIRENGRRSEQQRRSASAKHFHIPRHAGAHCASHFFAGMASTHSCAIPRATLPPVRSRRNAGDAAQLDIFNATRNPFWREWRFIASAQHLHVGQAAHHFLPFLPSGRTRENIFAGRLLRPHARERGPFARPAAKRTTRMRVARPRKLRGRLIMIVKIE